MVSARLLEYTVNISEHVSGFLGGIHEVVDAAQGVVLGQRASLCVVRLQALLQSLYVIIAASHQGLTGDVVRHVLLGRRKLFVVRPTTGLVDKTARDAAHQQTILNSEFDNGIQARAALLQQHVQLIKLNNGKRETLLMGCIIACGRRDRIK